MLKVRLKGAPSGKKMYSAKERETFTSYIDQTKFENISLQEVQKMRLLDGETLVHEAQRVLLYTPMSDRKDHIMGVLSVTTFKLSFVTTNAEDETTDSYQTNLLFRKNEMCLSCIDTIYQLGDKTRKRLMPGQSVSGRIKELLIICKNMRVMMFSFKHADADNGKNIANALLHHAFPKRHSLLFAYDFKGVHTNGVTTKDIRNFTTQKDWMKELERRKCTGNWRITDANYQFEVSTYWPKYSVVPMSVKDNATIHDTARYFRNSGFPVWTWGTDVAALVRMPDLLPTITDRTSENVFMERIRKSHPKKTQPLIVDLTRDCPTPREVQSSYSKLRSLCSMESSRLFNEQDLKFYGSLDNTKWYQHVSTCLTKAVEIGEKIVIDHTTVAIQEDTGQDMNCLISSLVQIIEDAHWRTRRGFQSLIQKEWVALGHPFAYRLGHVFEPEIEPSFLFLLFLDCVWQLLQQFPTAFQFTETYLTTIWDSAHITLFETFLFNSEHDRSKLDKTIMSVWDWSQQFTDDDMKLFNNPLYDRKFKSRLIPITKVSSIDIWRQCYFRWLPNLEIKNGGRPQIELFNRFLAEEIEILQCKVKQYKLNREPIEFRTKTKEDKLEMFKSINCFYPFGYNLRDMSSTINNEVIGADLDTQSMLNLPTD